MDSIDTREKRGEFWVETASGACYMLRLSKSVSSSIHASGGSKELNDFHCIVKGSIVEVGREMVLEPAMSSNSRSVITSAVASINRL